MKLLTLEMEGFTCYRKRVSLDFSDLELFAITGANGSGKSSLVDAIIFALYGKAPRQNDKEISTLIAQGMLKMHVHLEFAIGDQRYRLGRRVQRGKATDARLDIEKPGGWSDLCSGVKRVEQKMVEIIGLDYSAFTRCVILPQGAFAEFLHDSAGRQKILTRLLGLEVLEDMRKDAYQQKAEAQSGRKRLELLLAEQFAGVSVIALQQTKAQIAQLDLQLKQRQQAIATAEQNWQTLQNVSRLLETLRQLAAEKTSLAAVAEAIQTLELKLELAGKILPLLPQLEYYESWQLKSRTLKERARELTQEGELLDREEIGLRKNLAAAEQNYQRLPQLESKSERLQELRQLAKQLTEKEAERHRDLAGLADDEQRLKEVREQLAKLKKSLVTLSERQHRLTQHRHELDIRRQTLLPFQGMASLGELLANQRSAYEKRALSGQQANQLATRRKQEFDAAAAKVEEQEHRLDAVRDKLKRQTPKSRLEERLLQLEQACHLAQRWQGENAALEDEERRLGDESKRVEYFLAAQQHNRDELAVVEQKLLAVGDDQEQKQTRLQQGQNLLTPYRDWHKRVVDCDENKKQVAARKQKLTAAHKELAARQELLQADQQKLAQELTAAKAQWMAGYTENLAGAIRQHLTPGSPCPVCNQNVAVLPPATKQSATLVTQLEQRLKTAQAALEAQEQLVTSGDSQLASTRQLLEELEAQQKIADKELRAARAKLREIEKQLAAVFESEEYETEAARLQTEVIQLKQERDRLAKASVELKGKLRETEASLQDLGRRRQEREANIARRQKVCTELRAKIVELKVGDDVTSEQTSVRKLLTDIGKLETETAKWEKSLAVATAQKDTAWQQAVEAENRSREAQEESRAALDTWHQKQQFARDKLGIKDDNIEETLQTGLHQLNQLGEQLQQATLEEARCAKEQRVAELEEARQETAGSEMAQAVALKQQRMTALAQECSKMAAEITSETAGKEVDSLLNELKQRRKQIEEEYSRLHREQVVLEQRRRRWQDERQSAETVHRDLAREISQLEHKLAQAVQELKLASVDELVKAKVAPATLEQWQSEAAAGRLRLQQWAIRDQDCRSSLAGYPNVTHNCEQLAKAIALVEQERQTNQAMQSAGQEERGRLLQSIQQLERGIGQIAQIESDLRALSKTEELYSFLEQELQSDHFPGYIVEQALQTLCEDGSQQLDLLSAGRYAFVVDGRDFNIIDNWNNGEVRSAKTLSGGETFIASLALALALAERIYQLSNRRGVAPLETLFIDEGFGSLDEEHLEFVIKALQNLQGTGRTIGIISHLQQLNESLPHRLVVIKDRDGSTVRREESAAFATTS